MKLDLINKENKKLKPNKTIKLLKNYKNDWCFNSSD